MYTGVYLAFSVCGFCGNGEAWSSCGFNKSTCHVIRRKAGGVNMGLRMFMMDMFSFTEILWFHDRVLVW